MEIEKALVAFVLQLQADGRSEHTIGQYRRHVVLLGRWMAQQGLGTDLARLGHEDVARFLASPMARERAGGGAKRPTSVNALRSTVRCFFGYLHAAGELPTNPARLVRRAACGQRPPRALSGDERDRLLDALGRAETAAQRRDSVLVRLLLATGLRLGSALALDVEDMDLEAGQVEVRVAKGGWPQVTYLTDELVEALRKHMGERTGGPLFVGNHGRRLGRRQVQRRVGWWLQRAGVGRRASLHSLRHGFAMELYQRTGDLLLVQAALGHRSVSSTTVYVHCDRERLRAAMRSVGPTR